MGNTCRRHGKRSHIERVCCSKQSVDDVTSSETKYFAGRLGEKEEELKNSQMKYSREEGTGKQKRKMHEQKRKRKRKKPNLKTTKTLVQLDLILCVCRCSYIYIYIYKMHAYQPILLTSLLFRLLARALG